MHRAVRGAGILHEHTDDCRLVAADARAAIGDPERLRRRFHCELFGRAARRGRCAGLLGTQRGEAVARLSERTERRRTAGGPRGRTSSSSSPAQPAVPPAAGSTPAVGPPAATAARPTSQVRAAIRAACRSDFMTNCAGVQPGVVEAVACLQANAANLSSACRRAVTAISAGGTGAAKAGRAPADAAPPAAATAPPPMPPLPPIAELIIRRRCRPDIVTICPLPPGGGRIIECLVANTASLTPRCQGALAEARAMAR
jgi:hypothetical protein